MTIKINDSFSIDHSHSPDALVMDAPSLPYSDVTEDTWYYDIVCDFSAYGVEGGYSHGTSHPVVCRPC